MSRISAWPVGLGQVDLALAVLAVEQQPAAGDVAAAELDEPHQRQRRDRLARPDSPTTQTVSPGRCRN
jgi:hypothetical protein